MEKDESTPEGEQEQQNTEEEEHQEQEQPQEGSEDTQNTQTEDYRAKLNAQNRFLEKEGYEFKDGKWQRTEKRTEQKEEQEETSDEHSSSQQDLSSRDVMALVNAQVHEEDIDEVVKASKVLDVSIKDALQDEMVKNLIEQRKQHRQSAQAANTQTARPSSKQVSPDEIVKKASEGDIPEPGSKEAEELFWARRGGRPQE